MPPSYVVAVFNDVKTLLSSMSSTNPTLIQRWLKQNTAFYNDPDRVYNDADAILSRHPTLRPKTDVYTYDDGRTQLLLCLHGLLPITFRNVLYNIPVAIWLSLAHPREPPLVYVVPTNDMLVKAGKHIDLSGRCDLEYMSHWRRKPEACSLAGLLEAMQDHFSRDPPVYAKPRAAAPDRSLAKSQQQRHQSASPASSSGTHVHNHVTASSSAPEHPPLPPKPHAQDTALHGAPSSAVSSPTRLPSSSGPSQLPSSMVTPSPVFAQSPVSKSATTAAAPPERPPVPPHPGGLRHTQSVGPGPPPYVSPASGQWSRPPATVQHSVQEANPRWSAPISPQLSGHAQTAQVTAPAPPPIASYASSPQQWAQHAQTQAPAAITVEPTYAQLPPHVTSFSTLPTVPPPANVRIGHSSLGLTQPHTPQLRADYASTHGPVPTAQGSYSQPGEQTLPPSSVVSRLVPPSIPPPDLLDEDDLPSSAISPAATAATQDHSAAPPPRPPNPELLRLQAQLAQKLHEAIAALSTSVADATARQHAMQRDLLAGGPAIHDEMGRLVAVRDVCRTASSRLRAVVQEAEGNIAEVRRKGEPEVDELVCSTSIVHNQLINLVAEDNAIEDTIYHLHRALNSGRIDLERFLRTTRVLAEEQFMKRALVEKILRGIPMGSSVM